MKRLIASLTVFCALVLPAAASAQDPPIAATVPWVANSPNVPHDIVSGVPTRVKGLELGRDPVAGVRPFGPLTSITIESLSTCSAGAQNFSLNGVAVGTIPNGYSCTCTPVPQTINTTAAAALAAWNSANVAANTARIQRPAGEYVTWFAMTVHNGAQSERVCIYDKTGGDCTTNNLCAGYDYGVAVDQSATFGTSNSQVFTGATYSWDFGDGSAPTAPAAITAANRRNLSAARTYTGAPGSPFNARLTICDAASVCTTSTYRMVIRADVQGARTNMAIDEGLWYLHTRQQSTGQILADGSYGERVSGTASAVNAFEAHGHLGSQSRLTNPYAETVQRGLRYVFKNLASGATSAQPAGNPDSNGNGRFLAPPSPQVYETGMSMDAIITSGTPNAIVDTGVAQGETYAQVVQDMVDAYAFGQMDNQDARRRGSWHYEFAHGANSAAGHADNSSSGWGAIGMIPAERNWGLTVPAFVKSENLLSMEACYSPVGNECATIGYGAVAEFGGNACIWGCAATTPNGMVQLLMDGKGPGENAFGTTPAFDRAARWLAENWGSGANENNSNTVLGYTYGMFAVVKAMRIAGIETLTIDSNGCAGGGTDTPFDWFNDPTRGIAKVLTTRQQQSAAGAGWGRWDALGGAGSSGLATQWSLLMLASELFQQGPKAVAAVNPSTVAPAQVVTFNHAGSYHLDASKTILTYEWDLDGNGSFEYSTNDANATPTTTYPSLVGPFPKTVTATLRVTDNNNPALSDSAQVVVTIDIQNVPPVAAITQTGGTLAVNSPINLSGATSFDPNAGPPPGGLNDSVVEYAWDLDESNGLNTFTTLGVAQTVQFASTGPHTVALRVQDSFGLTNTTFFTLDIPVNQAPTADAGPDQTLECVDGAASATLDGALSSDPDNDPLTYAWSNGATSVSPVVQVAFGAANFSLIVNDGLAASAADSVTITVADSAGPEVTCNDVLVECTSPNGTPVADSAFNALADDACEGPLAATSDDLLPTYPMGNTPVSFSANDAGGLMGQCDAEVIVQDTTDPTITCPANAVLDADASCRAVSGATASAADTCDSSVTVASDAPAAFGLGETPVVFTATDDQTNSASCTQLVKVIDVTSPDPVCPPDQAVNTDAGRCVATVAVGQATATDNCDASPTISGTPASEFALGATTTEFSATDDAANSRACTTTVTVTDAEKPSIVCPGAIVVPSDAAGCGTMVVVEPQSVTDNCDAEVSVSSTAPVLFGLGETSVTLTARDNFGNESSCTTTVTVLDITNPTVTCPPSRTLDAPADACGIAVDFGTLTATDNCTSTLTVTDNAPDVFPVGNTTVTFWIEDEAGNVTTCDSTIVSVLDVTKPTLTCPAPVSVNADAATCRQAVTLTATATDACEVASIDGNGTESYALGTTEHGFTATDGTGNQSVCSTPVTVVDATPPDVNAGADFSVDANTACEADAELHGSASDACGVASYQWQDDTGAILGNTATLSAGMLGIGPHVFTLTACDAAGNCASDTVTVTIATTAMACFQVRHVNLKMSDRSGHGDDEDDEDDDAEDRRDCSRSRYLHNHLYTRGTFELNECNAIDLAASGATVKIDGQTFVVPPGAFQVRSFHRYTYRSPKADTGWWRLTVDLRKNRWTFKSWHMTNEGLNTADGLTVSLALGTQVGSATVALTRNGSARNGYNYGYHGRGADCTERCRGGHNHGNACHHGRQHHEESCGHNDHDDRDEHRNRNRHHDDDDRDGDHDEH